METFLENPKSQPLTPNINLHSSIPHKKFAPSNQTKTKICTEAAARPRSPPAPSATAAVWLARPASRMTTPPWTMASFIGIRDRDGERIRGRLVWLLDQLQEQFRSSTNQTGENGSAPRQEPRKTHREERRGERKLVSEKRASPSSARLPWASHRAMGVFA